jgi:hypothetical protein
LYGSGLRPDAVSRMAGRDRRFRPISAQARHPVRELPHFTRQSARAATPHSTYLASGEKTCIDCHKGTAHQLLDMKRCQAGMSPAPRPFICCWVPRSTWPTSNDGCGEVMPSAARHRNVERRD